MTEGQLKKKRLEASYCWELASNFTELSLTAKEVLKAMERFVGKPRLNPGRITREELCQKCDELIQVEDAGVRIMVLKAILQMDYYGSPQIGLIASFLGSKEKGRIISYPEGEEVGAGEEFLEPTAGSYLCSALDLKEVCLVYQLEQLANHWVPLFDPRIQKEWISKTRLANKNGKVVVVKLTPQEIEKERKEAAARTEEHARHAFATCIRKLRYTDFIERRVREVRQGLNIILGHALLKTDPETLGKIIALLSGLARKGSFPARWVLEVVEDRSFSSSIEKLLVI